MIYEFYEEIKFFHRNEQELYIAVIIKKYIYEIPFTRIADI